MAAGIGSKVEYLDYNAIQTIVNGVFGIGAGDSGYGQSVTSNQVSQYATITVSQWNSLRNDLLKSRQHQSGSDESGNLALPTLDTKISESDRAAYLSMATLVQNNRTISPPSSEASFINLITGTRSPNWTSTVSHTITIEFGTANKLRWFFNAGGNFQISSSLNNYETTGNSKLVNESWATLLTNMGTIKLTRSSTTNTGTGTPAISIGYANLISSDQLIFSKLVEAGNQYTPNQYDLYARILNGTALVLTPTWSYTDAGGDGAYRVFEPVTGTLTSVCQMYIASGENVATSYPYVSGSGSQWSFTSAYIQPVPTYFITPGATSVNEGSTVTYTVNTSNVANGTTLYWTNSGTTQAADFVGSANSGSVTITSDTATFTRQLTSDVTTEGPETVVIDLRINSISGNVVATADTVTVNDTSLTQTSYNITQNTTSVNEGSSVIFTVTTTNVTTGTTLYWTTASTTISSTDFTPNETAGSFTINNNTATITRSITADLLTEGVESFQLVIKTGSTSGTPVATSSVITINDVSLTPPPTPTYTVTPVTSNVNEGSSLTFNVAGTNIVDGTYYWTINNSTTSNTDFSTLSGSFAIASNVGSFTVTPVSDSSTEGSEVFTVTVRTSSTNGTVVATSSTVTVNDTSTGP
jgi:hypothetical protein